ncbi:hypothetical protein D3C72_1767170 [compost metagenome]
MQGRALLRHPVSQHQHPGAVGHQDHRALDARQRLRYGLDPGLAAQLVRGQRRHCHHLLKLLGEQGLPVIRYVVTQAGHYQYCGLGLKCLHLSSPVQALRRRPDDIRTTVRCQATGCFTLGAMELSLYDRSLMA